MVIRSTRLAVTLVIGLLLALGAATAVVAQTGPAGVRGQGGASFDEDAVLQTLNEWALGYDTEDSAMMRDAFTDDATFIYASPAFDEPLVFSGIDEVMALFEGALAEQDDQRRHVLTNSVVERIDRTTVEVTSYLTLFSIPDPEGSPILKSTGVYRDTVRLESDGQWRIEVRDLTLDTAA